MQYKNVTKIIIDKRKLDVLIRLGCPDKQILELIKTGKFTKTGDSLIDETLECLIDLREFQNWGGKRKGSGRRKNHLENQVENQVENHLEIQVANQDIFQVVDIDKDKDNIKNKLINYGELKKVCLTSDEYERLKSKYGDLLEPAIEKLDGWIATTTKKIKKGSHYAYFKSDSWVWENLRPIVHGVCHDVPDTKREQESRLARMAELAKIESMKRVQQKYGA